MHEEMPQPRDGMMSGFQLWVNLPARLKMTSPNYQEVPSRRIPEVLRENGVRIRIITGTVDGRQGPVTGIAADPIYLDVWLPSETAFHQPVERGHNGFAYVFEGEGLFGGAGGSGGVKVQSPRMVVFDDGDVVEVRTSTEAVRFLLVSGRPLHEPIARYGPFVMNTREEIEQTLRELREGTFVTARG